MAENFSNKKESPQFHLSLISLISLICSILGFLLYSIVLSGAKLKILWVIVSLISIVLPVIAKQLRLKENKSGKILEIFAIVIGGFNFYCIIFAATTLSIYVGYLGWIVCAIAYKYIKNN